MTTTPEILMRPFGDFVARAPANLAPERQHDLGAIWNGLPWEILFGCGEANFAAIPADGVGGEPYIVAKYAGLLSLWAATRGALIIFDAVLAAVSLGESTIPSEPGSEFLRGIAYIDFARELVRDQNAPFPGSLDSPDPSGKTMESERGNNLFLGAVGWVLLHEIGHIQLGHQAGVPEAVSKQQENDADRFASDWIFSDLHIDQRHREFRVAAVAAAML